MKCTLGQFVIRWGLASKSIIIWPIHLFGLSEWHWMKGSHYLANLGWTEGSAGVCRQHEPGSAHGSIILLLSSMMTLIEGDTHQSERVESDSLLFSILPPIDGNMRREDMAGFKWRPEKRREREKRWREESRPGGISCMPKIGFLRHPWKRGEGAYPGR